MAFVRPIVYVYQQYTNVTVAPGTPDLNCCIVGPAYNIRDYPLDKDDIELADFIKAGETADAPCNADGTSFGRPDPGTDFLTVSDSSRPEHVAGAVLDDASVQIIFDDLYIEVGNGAAGAIADGDYLFTDSSDGDFSGYDADGNAVNASGAQKIAAGDRIVLTKTPGGTGALTDVKSVAYVVSATVLALTSTKKDDYVTWPNEDFGNTLIRWRVEHQLDDQQIDTAYYAIAAGDITIKTGALGILLTYQALTWPVNYAKMYLGYRELRVDLDDVTVINSIDDITASEDLIGRVDERNPLAAGVKVALANTGNPIQAFGVSTDDLTGHQSARDRMTSRSDIYCIVPVTGALSGSDWVNVIAMWKNHCVAFAAFDVGKFRVVLGSYDILPTEKASAPASLVGYTILDPVNTTLFDVMVDPAASADFEVAEIDSTHLLDLMHGTTMKTVVANSHIFTDTYAAKELLGVIGKKRLRTTAADKFSVAASAESNGYIVRNPYLKGEGGSGYTEDVDAITWADNGSAKARIGKTGGFSNATVGDVAKVSGGATGGNNGGWLVIAVNADYIDVELTYAADANSGQPGFACQVYRCVTGGYVSDGDITGGNTFNDQAAGSSFANALVGDVILCWDSATSANKGMWVITNKTDDNNVIVGTPATLTNDATNATVVSLLRIPYKAISANASLTARLRLTRLRDDTASFTTSVEAGEDINIPYPAEVDPLKWDTATTQWPIETVVNDNMLDALLGDLEELAPELFVAGFDGDMPYRISIDLNPDSQVTELNTITSGLESSRCVMTWPNSVYVSDLENELTGVQSTQKGQYLACAVGGMTAGLPSHQGFTYIGIAGIQQIFNSNFYFTESQLTDLRDGGWYVFKQDSESSLPYTIHEVTTDVTAYEFGEFMNVKNFDYIALYMKEILDNFLGKYNITTETMEMIRASLNAGASYLKLRIFPKIGTPLLEADITYLGQSEDEVDRVEVYMDITMPKVLNRIGLHLVA